MSENFLEKISENLPVNEIICGDCIEEMEKIPSDFVDSIITDVPYNSGETDSKKMNFGDREDLNKASESEWNKGFNPTAFLPEAKRVMKDKGNIFIFTHHRHFGDYYRWLDSNFDRCFFGVWHKTNPPPQIRKVSFLSACELWIMGYNKGHKWVFLDQNEMHNFIETPICMGEERTKHTAQKPIEVMKKMIKVSTNKGDLVLDPFVGSGTTCVAAAMLNRDWIGIENNIDYVKVARDRLSKIPKDKEKLEAFCD